MHICPQEIIAILQAMNLLQPTIGMLSVWCKSCIDGTHQSCEDHANDVKLNNIHIVND